MAFINCNCKEGREGERDERKEGANLSSLVGELKNIRIEVTSFVIVDFMVGGDVTYETPARKADTAD